jgi:hypothetical protein
MPTETLIRVTRKTRDRLKALRSGDMVSYESVLVHLLDLRERVLAVGEEGKRKP